MLPKIDGGIGKLLLLLSAGVPVSCEDGYSPFVVSSARGALSELQMLCEQGEITKNDLNISFMAGAGGGSEECLEYLHSKGAELDGRDSQGRTALFYTIFHNQFGCFLYLLKEGAETSLIDYQFRNILHVAAYYGRLNFVEHLLHHYKEASKDLLCKKDKYGCTSFHYAVVQQQEDLTDSLLQLCRMDDDNKILNEKDNKGLTILQYACMQKDCEDWVEYLLDEGCDMKACDISGHTPLHHSVLTANHEVIKTLLMFLLTNKAFDELHFVLNQKACGGYTPLHYAILTENVALFKVLISSYKKSLAGSKNEISLSKLVDDKGRNILHMAAFMNHVELCKLVIHFFPSVCSLKDKQHRNALFYAVRNVHAATPGSEYDLDADVLEFLVSCSSAKLNVNRVDSEGRSILHYACYYNHLDQVKYLLTLQNTTKKVKTFDTADNKGFTPLHVAAAHGHAECVRMLILMGSFRMNDKDIYHRTPLHVAVENKHVSCTEVLIQLGASSTEADRVCRTPLHYACLLDIKQSAISEQIIQIILQDSTKSAATAADAKGITPLLLMCAIGNIRSTKEILYHLLRRVSVGPGQESLSYPDSLMDARKWSPMHFAAFHGHAEVLRVLLEYFDASTESIEPMKKWKNDQNMTPFHFACSHRSSSLCVKILLDNHIDTNVIDKFGRTGLHIAAGNGNTPTCKILLKNSPQLLSIRDNNERYAYQYVKLDEDQELAELLAIHETSLPAPNSNMPLSQDISAPGIRSTPRKLRKKSISNITIRSRTPAAVSSSLAHPKPVAATHIPLTFTDDDDDTSDLLELLNSTKAKSSIKRSQTSSVTRSLTPARPKKPLHFQHRTKNSTSTPSTNAKPVPVDIKRSQQTNQKQKTPLTTSTSKSSTRVATPSKSKTPASQIRSRTPTRRAGSRPGTGKKETPQINKENLKQNKPNTPISVPYTSSPHQNVFERLNAHAVARQQARKAAMNEKTNK